MESNNNGEIQDFQLNIIQEDHQEQISHIQDMTAPQAFIFPSETPPAPSISWPPLPLGIHSNTIEDQHHRFLPPLPPLPSNHHIHQFYGDFYGRRATSTPFYDGGVGGGYGLGSSDPLGLMGLYTSSIPSSSPFGVLHAELGRMSAQEIMDAKALAASKSHSEAERRRRERINAHLSRLRSLLPSTTKTDKASLLAEVIQHVKELKRQMSEIAEESPLPTESDELTVDYTSDEDGRLVVRASLCCDDRADLLPDLIKALKSLRLRALKAEITTLGGRVKNVLVIAGDGAADPDGGTQQYCVATIQEALKAVMERAAAEETSAAGGTKRQRTTNLSSILEHRSI